MNRRFSVPALWLLAAFGVAPLLSVAEPGPKPQGIAVSAAPLFARFIKASGGDEAIRKRTSRVTKGQLTAPAMGVSGKVEILQVAPGKTFQTFEIAAGLTFTMGADGKVAWQNVPGFGVQELEGEQREQFLDESDLFKILRLAQRFTKAEVVSVQKLGALDCDVVSGTTRNGKTETLFFSRADGLLIRWDRDILTQNGQWAPAETWMDDYRDVDGLKVPFHIRQPKPAAAAFELKVTEVKHGVTAPDAKFKKPGS